MIVSLDAYHYFGTDDCYIGYITRFIKPGGRLGVVVPALTQHLSEVPPELAPHWTHDFWSFHGPDWWRRRWTRSGLVDVWTAFLNCHLHDEDVAERHGLPSAEERALRLGIFSDAYELDATHRRHLVDRMIEVAVRGAASDEMDAGITPDDGPVPLDAWGIAWQVRSAAWMLRHRALLKRAVSA